MEMRASRPRSIFWYARSARRTREASPWGAMEEFRGSVRSVGVGGAEDGCKDGKGECVSRRRETIRRTERRRVKRG